MKLPILITVSEIISSRYKNHEKPLSWDDRVAGIDTVRTTDGSLVKLSSDGGQSPPKPGWKLVLSGGNVDAGFEWTLYSISNHAVSRDSASAAV